MELVSMEMSEHEAKEAAGIPTGDRPKYPWGLCINLDEEDLEKLGIEDLPEIVEEMVLVARVKVTAASERENAAGSEDETECNVSLQITEMALDVEEDDDEEKRKRADKLYEHAEKLTE